MVTSSKSRLNRRSRLSKWSITAARFCRPPPADAKPFQIKSSPRPPRSDLIDRSPSTQRKASAQLDLPEPLGPTIAVIGRSKRKVVGLANDLNPESSNFFNRIIVL